MVKEEGGYKCLSSQGGCFREKGIHSTEKSRGMECEEKTWT